VPPEAPARPAAVVRGRVGPAGDLAVSPVLPGWCVHTDVMRRMGVRQARAQLTAVVRQAASGQPVLLTRHGRPVAVVLPAEAEQMWRAQHGGRDERDPGADEDAEVAGPAAAGTGAVDG
jgi:prevent-host-death family protein